MQSVNARAEEAKQVYELFWDSYLKGDLDTFASTLDEDFEMIGTSESEVAHNKSEGIEFYKSQMQEVVGKADMRNREIFAKPINGMVLINENCDIYVQIDQEWTFYSKIRISTLLHETPEGWKVIQQHGSLPDMRVQEGETMAIEKINKENLELRDAVKRRTSELENKNRQLAIEAALEKVRTVAMGMKKPEDMLDICRIISEQLQQFGVEKIRNIQTAIIDEEKGIYLCYQYFTPYGKEVVERTQYLKNPVEEEMVRQMLNSKNGHFNGILEGKELKEFRQHRKEENHFPDPLLEEAKEISYCFLSIGLGGLGLTLYRPLDDSTLDLFRRFHQVFSLAFQRFRDIQKAEAQVREAEIQLALERVRARTMAMHQSDELQQVIEVVYEQMVNLTLPVEHAGFILDYKKREDMHIWFASKQVSPSEIIIPYFDSPHWNSYQEAKANGKNFFANRLAFEEKNKFYQELFRWIPPLPKEAQEAIFRKPGLIISTFLMDNVGLYVENYSETPFTEYENGILERFGNVFQQAYTRFLDLQKAEAQAKEAQIESALERVRSRSLAMHHSSELSSVVDTLLQEFTGLDFTLTFCIINLIDGDDLSNTVWAANPETGKDAESYYMKFEDYDFHRAMWNAWKAQDKRFVYVLEGEEKKIYDEYLYSETEFKRFPKHVQEANKTLERYVAGFTFFKYSGLQTVSVNPISEEELAILERFGKVFEQAYIRFLDLQKAEEQAREAEIELALERVRARTMAMQNSDELAEVSSLLFQQMKELGVTTYGSGFTIWDEDQDKLISWVCNADGSLNPPFYLPMTEEPWHKEQYESWKKGEDFIVKDLAGEDWKAYFRYLRSFPLLDKAFATSEAAGHPIPVRQVHHAANFSHGNLLFITLEPRPEAHDLFKRFAKVFEQTYTRFLDLQKAEAQAREAEIELALERVRARTMAMQHSEELLEVATLLFQQVKGLGVPQWNCGFNIWELGDEAFTYYPGTPDGIINPSPCKIPLNEHPVFRRFDDSRKKGIDLLVYEKEGEEQKDHYEYMLSLPRVGDLLKSMLDAGFELPTYQIDHLANFAYGNLIFITYEHFPEMHKVFKRFAKVFEQTYTRFLDLQKAEAQTRAAQINLAVERVRARALAMFKSEEILEVVIKLKEEIMGLDIPGVAAAAILLKGKNGMFRSWDLTSLELNGESMHTPLDVPFDMEKTHPDFYLRKVWEKGTNYTVVVQDTESLQITCNWLRENNKIKEAEEAEEFLKSSGLQRGFHPTVPLNNGRMILDLLDPPEDEIEFILTKMGGAFDLAYKRFEDLKNSEEQLREAQIEGALERVRSQTMGMQTSKDLSLVTTAMFEQLRMLGGEMYAAGIVFCDKDKNQVEQWHSVPGAGMLSPFIVPVDLDYIHQYRYDQWKKGTELFSVEIPEDFIEQHFETMFQLPTVKAVFDDFAKKNISMPETPTWEIDYGASFKQGYILVSALQPFDSADILPRFAKVFEQTYTRFLDLQKAEASAKEAKIEAALEKVRSRTMAMQKGEELKDVAVLLYKELIALGVTNFVSCGYVEIHENIGKQYVWITSPGGDTLGLFYLPLTGDPTFDERYAAWKNQQTIFHQTVAGEVRSSHLEYAITTFQSKEAEEMVRSQFPNPTVFYCFNFSHGYLHLVTGSLLEEEEEMLLARFTKVFEQTYTRFLDLQKAEAQAREAKIEASLEKVRSRTMGMQHSDELPEAANLLFLEIQALGIPSWSAGYNILAEDIKSATCWMSSEGTLQKPFQLRLWGEASFDEMGEFVKSKKTILVQELGDKAIKEHYEYMKSFPDLKPTFDDIEAKGLSLPTYQINHLYKFTQGFVLFITYEKVPEAHDIFKRFTKVFEQTYTRFLDLKKAEKQAKEAQIELSLERIRAQVTAMRESQDLLEIVVNMRKEFVNLGHEAHYFWHMRWLPKTYAKAMTSGDGTQIGMVMSLPRHIHGDIPDVAAWEKGTESIHVLAMDVDLAVDYVDKMIQLGDFERVDPQAPTLDDIRHIGGLTFVMARTTHGEIGYSLPGKVDQPPKDAIETLTRFAGVFDLAYKRFEDLKKAEAQIRDEKIKNALERVRSRSLAMHKSSELTDVIQTVNQQFKELEIDISGGAFIVINKDLENGFYCWGAGGVGNYVRRVKIPFIDRPIYQTLSNGIKHGNPFFTEYYDKEEKRAFFKHLFKHDPFNKTPRSSQESLLSVESDYTRSCVVSKNTSIFIINHDGKQFSDEENEFLRQMGRVFEQAYTRFIDLEKAEKQARQISEERDRLEITLNELKATQAQLIQQEKLASLGQLTAGIAHEIKNPLNFVNNFSDLSRELIEEVFEELKNLEASAIKEEIIAILHDVQSNLNKVHEHGSRADGIVTSMLQHSRASGSKQEPKAFNPLVREFVNLSFHGMRAGKAPINVDIDLQLDDQIGDVTLISEDFSRVILNLCNNAFDAMRDKFLKTGDGSPETEAYFPKLTVKTALQKDKVILSIGDNGGGIPEEIQDKILQPFFTTKKGTEGTGLGLSITNDIVKAHGGQLEIESSSADGTTFSIHLKGKN